MIANQLRRKTPAELVDLINLPEDVDPWVAAFVADMRNLRNQQGKSLFLSVKQIMKIREILGDKVAKKANKIVAKQKRSGN
jgi:hypothetical protein